MTPRRRVGRWLALLVCAALALTGCDIYSVPLPGGANVGSKPMTVHVMFRDVLDLVPQSTVKVNDVTVGKVTKIQLKGYTADVTIQMKGSTRLPDNERAAIQQTSLLGEKFIALLRPASPGSGRLGNGDVIPLSRTGRNPEVEEVLKALSALLNGGGVGQLKTIAHELNTAVGGREQDVRSVLDQLHYFMGELDRNKAAVVQAIDNVDRLARELRHQEGTIKLALDNLPAAIRSVNGQRHDLVRVLSALDRLSGVGVRVIKASKGATIDSLRDLAPVLYQLAKAGSALPRSLQIGLTYPFLDAAVGNSPQVARNLHIGDYVNLSAYVNLDLTSVAIGLPKLGDTLKGAICTQVPPSAGGLGKLCDSLAKILNKLPSTPTVKLPLKGLLGGGGTSTGTKTPKNLLGQLGSGSGLLGHGRAPAGPAHHQGRSGRSSPSPDRHESGIGTLLAQGVTR
ncbi:MAG: MCE family protein [Sciscionella sp.]